MFDGAYEDTSEERSKRCCAMAVKVLTIISFCAQNGINEQTKGEKRNGKCNMLKSVSTCAQSDYIKPAT